MNRFIESKKNFICILLIALSLLLIGLGFYHLHSFNKYYKDGDKVNAYVENILIYPNSDSETYEEELDHYKELLKQYKAMGIISSHEGTAIIITYRHNDQNITTSLGYFSDDISIGQSLTIYVNQNDSKDFIYEGENKFGLYFCMTVGTVLLIASLIFFLIYKHNDKCNILLKQKGKKIEATIIFADEDESKTSFNKHPFIFTCSYKEEETNKEYFFTSESVYCKNNGQSYINKKITIYTDPNNYNNFYIDTKQFEK